MVYACSRTQLEHGLNHNSKLIGRTYKWVSHHFRTMSKSTKEKDYGQYSSGKYIQKSRLDELFLPSIIEPFSHLNTIFYFNIRPSKKRNADKTRMFSLVITSQILLSTMNQPLQVEPLQALWQLFWKDPKNINRYVVIKYSPGQWMWQSTRTEPTPNITIG